MIEARDLGYKIEEREIFSNLNFEIKEAYFIVCLFCV